MKGSLIGCNSRGMLRESASATAELRPVTELEHPLPIMGLTSERLALEDSVCDDLCVIKALLPASEKTRPAILYLLHHYLSSRQASSLLQLSHLFAWDTQGHQHSDPSAGSHGKEM